VATLIVLLGPTAVGKTELSISIAEMLNSPIISADSRQMFRGIEIGTAAPTQNELERVKHYFIGNLDLREYYSAAEYEKECLALLEQLFTTHSHVVLTGGSMMYIDAVCKGIDEIPTVNEDVRQSLKERLEKEGLESLFSELQTLDPDYSTKVDTNDHKRILHALEICHQTGRTFTSFRTGQAKQRPFNIIKIGLERPREELFDRINKRVTMMLNEGFEQEARKVYPLRHLNSLNTVGFKEMFQYISGEWTLDFAADRIRKNTRVYSKKQMTWFKRDESIKWFSPLQKDEILEYIHENS